MAMAMIQMKINDELKQEADRLFKNLGMDTNTAIKIFIRQSLQKGGLPFKVKDKRRRYDPYIDEEEKRDYDAEFYNEENVRILKERYDKLQAGFGEEKELINA